MSANIHSGESVDTFEAMGIAGEQTAFVEERRRLLGRAMLPPNNPDDFRAFLDHIQSEWDHWNGRADGLASTSADGKDRRRTFSQLQMATRELSEVCAALETLSDTFGRLSGAVSSAPGSETATPLAEAPPRAAVPQAAAPVPPPVKSTGPAPDAFLLESAKLKDQQAWMHEELKRREQADKEFRAMMKKRSDDFYKGQDAWRKTFKT